MKGLTGDSVLFKISYFLFLVQDGSSNSVTLCLFQAKITKNCGGKFSTI